MGDISSETSPYAAYEDPSTNWEVIVASNNSTDNMGDGHETGGTILDALAYMSGLVLLAFFCYCSRSRVPDERFRIAAAERRARWRERQQRKERMSDPDFRSNLVEKAIVSKTVIAEKDGQLILGDAEGTGEEDDQSSSGGSMSIDSMDENTSTCVICLDAFRVGDVVAMSKTLLDAPEEETCNHVFHRECIVSWLMSPTRDECPSCRSIIVHEEEGADDDGRGGNGRNLRENSAFVIMHGLVSRVRRASYSLIGQSIDVYDEDIDLEIGHKPPKVPPSPMRRVVSLEASPHSPPRRPSLRRRPSSGSTGSRSSLASDTALPEVMEDEDMVVPKKPSPSPLRRVLSDTSTAPVSTSPLPFARQSSAGRRFRLPLRISRGYQRVASVPSEDSSERSFDEEDDILHRGGSLLTVNLETSSEEAMREESTIREDKAC